jgi:serine protease Do
MTTPTRRTLLMSSLAGAVGALAGCAAPPNSTRLVQNTGMSEAVKARSFKSYTEVLFVPPPADPRNLVPRMVKEFEAMGYKTTLVTKDKPIDTPQGTAFVISPQGHVLTCAHVVGDFKEATLTLNGQTLMADVLKADKAADLALLKLRLPLPPDAPFLSFRDEAKPYSLGEDVFTIGYPLSRILGNSARMSKGLLSATAGLRDDPKQVQISAEIHPGNSGGPLMDREGNVLGVINQTINPARVQQATGGALPQNINFAIKNGPVMSFLRTASTNALAGLKVEAGGGLDRANKAVAKLQAGALPNAQERRNKLVVRFGYAGTQDMWFRFRSFGLMAEDYETRELLFVAVNGPDVATSGEEALVANTLAQVRKALAAR